MEYGLPVDLKAARAAEGVPMLAAAVEIEIVEAAPIALALVEVAVPNSVPAVPIPAAIAQADPSFAAVEVAAPILIVAAVPIPLVIAQATAWWKPRLPPTRHGLDVHCECVAICKEQSALQLE